MIMLPIEHNQIQAIYIEKSVTNINITNIFLWIKNYIELYHEQWINYNIQRIFFDVYYLDLFVQDLFI